MLKLTIEVIDEMINARCNDLVAARALRCGFPRR